MNLFRLVTHSSKVSAADQTFKNSGWGGYQFVYLHLKLLTDNEFSLYKSGIIKRFNDFSFKNSKIIEDNSELKIFLKNYFKKSRNCETDTFTIYILTNQKIFGFIGNHAICDGIIMYSILGILCNFNPAISIPKYFRIPLISEISVTEYVIRSLVKSINYKPLEIQSKNYRYSIIYELNGRKRWDVYAKVLETIFNVLDPSIKNLRIAFTVAWEDNQSSANNRIGAIIIDIPRLKSEDEYMQYVKKNIMKYKMDSLTSYELVKSYYLPFLREKFCKKIDGVFSAFIIPNHVNGFYNYYGGFCGNLKSPFYICVMSGINQKPKPLFGLSIQTSTPLFDGNAFMKINKTTTCYDEGFPLTNW